MRLVAGISKNESAVETMIAIMVDTSKSPRTMGRPAYRAIAGITDSLPDCLASNKAAGSVSPVCASATRSGMIPFAAATAPVSPSIDITDSSITTPMIQKKTAFFADPPLSALKIRWYMFASPIKRSIVGTKKLIAMIGPEMSPVLSDAQLPNHCHLPADSATKMISLIPPTSMKR